MGALGVYVSMCGPIFAMSAAVRHDTRTREPAYDTRAPGHMSASPTGSGQEAASPPLTFKEAAAPGRGRVAQRHPDRHSA